MRTVEELDGVGLAGATAKEWGAYFEHHGFGTYATMDHRSAYRDTNFGRIRIMATVALNPNRGPVATWHFGGAGGRIPEAVQTLGELRAAMDQFVSADLVGGWYAPPAKGGKA